VPAKRSIYQDKAAGPGLGKFDALLASREAHEELLLGAIEPEQVVKAGRERSPSILARFRAWLRELR
jgi:hypothetical protein